MVGNSITHSCISGAPKLFVWEGNTWMMLVYAYGLCMENIDVDVQWWHFVPPRMVVSYN